MTGPSRWDWALYGRHEGFCLTFTHGILPAAILRRYGVDPSEARTIALPQVHDALQPDPDSSVLRVGTFREWAFCFETLGVQGIMPAVLAALSQGTQTIAVSLGANALHILEHWVDRQPRERFEPGQASSLQARDVHPLWDAAERHRANHSELPAILGALEAVGDLVGGHLTADVIEGPLLSTVLPWTLPPLPSLAAPLPFVQMAETRPLGPRIGSLRLPPNR